MTEANKGSIKGSGLIDLDNIANENWDVLTKIPPKSFNIRKKVVANSIEQLDQRELNIPISDVVSTKIPVEIVTEVKSVEDKVFVSQVSPTSVHFEEDSKFSVKDFMNGLTYLFVSKSANLLNPLSFLVNNYKTVFMALVHLAVPSVMAWYALTQISMISMQLAKEPIGMHVIYSVMFWMASIFVWVLAQLLLYGALSMFKSAGKSVSNVGRVSDL